ncbi:hypothetical protein [Pseudomonas monteilii]|uniref:hypothetical protein n=1 Tax=Pseudomonas monteilii TaxID=76759 RepID=UPI0015FE35F9|nr:hypothetical protein [Pseudomonas monteilii]MBA6105312.1 hypothetical protein [Pseudomonas monteilii]
MNMIWYLFRPFYAVGLFPVVLIVAVVLFNASKDPEITAAVLLSGGVYFALGYLVFSVVPKWLRARLLSQVKACAPEVNVEFEAMSCLLNRYVGFDRYAQKLIYVDIDGTHAVLDFPEVNAWHVEVENRKPALLKLMTSVAGLPLIGIRFDRRQSNELMARLTASFG